MKQVEISSNVFISPPNDGHITYEDSGEEDSMTINNLPGIQITSESYIEDDIENNVSVSVNKSIKSKKNKIKQWKNDCNT